MTEDEARSLIARLINTDNPITLYPFEHGWVAQETLSEHEVGQGMHIGQGSFVIDRSGLVTVHSSLPIPLIAQAYTEARAEGRISGLRLWPPTTPDPEPRG